MSVFVKGGYLLFAISIAIIIIGGYIVVKGLYLQSQMTPENTNVTCACITDIRVRGTKKVIEFGFEDEKGKKYLLLKSHFSNEDLVMLRKKSCFEVKYRKEDPMVNLIDLQSPCNGNFK